jgi:uncharacterized membrane protein (DUF373 family)
MPATGFSQLQKEWRALTYYQRFESGVALVLTAIVALIIVVALFRLGASVLSSLLVGARDPLDHGVFQSVFGEIMTLLIALEFNHTLQYVVTRQQSIIQASVVVLIALLALARKFIILDLRTVTEGQLIGLAAATLALGLTYWLIGARQGPSDAASPPRT